MSTKESNGTKLVTENYTLKILINLKTSFLLGIFVGTFLLRHQLMLTVAEWFKIKVILGYEYNAEDDCVIVRKKNGKLDWCRPIVDCSMCKNLSEIDILESSEINQKIFRDTYAYTGRPLLVRNATNWWPASEAFTFTFFRDIYESLDSPVLYNDDPDCQFFSWQFHEFSHLQQVFDMSDDRWQMSGNYSPWYIGWANCDEEAGEILRDYYKRPDFLPEDSESGRRDWFFLGTTGYGAPYHIDNVKYPSWQAQVSGTKSWSLRPPPECWWSCTSQMNVTLFPGDVIIVNTNWWYHATNVIDGLSVTVTNEYL